MEVLDKETKFAHLGKPGGSFSKGFQRRFDILKKQVMITPDMRILDQGCGEGVWLEQFAKTVGYENVYGFDIDKEFINRLPTHNPKLITQNLKACPAEEVDFPDNFFDIVFSNEVFEHVEDDAKAAQEALRILKPGGKLIVFTPNRGWPFETHGMFWRGKYIWGNIPFLPWMPRFVREKFAPHVRNYSNGEIRSVITSALIDNSSFVIRTSNHVFPAFDKLERKFGFVGKLMQRIFHTLEKTPLHFFGISHFVVAEKIEG
jgi:ubiquinone/menaquinone biosynthesis C-methylase UbiE